MINAKVTKNFDLSKISLDLHRELNRGIDIIADDIEAGIDKGIQFGEVFKPIEEKTADRKGHDRPLIDTGDLKDAGKMVKSEATAQTQVATLLPNEEREDISFWHNTGAKPNPPREHWGISNKAELKVDKIIDKAVRKQIDRTRRARIA